MTRFTPSWNLTAIRVAVNGSRRVPVRCSTRSANGQYMSESCHNQNVPELTTVDK